MELIGEFHKAEKNISSVKVSNSSPAANLALQHRATFSHLQIINFNF